ncbi:hypothetical protein KIS4809_2308 [Bacillus sp. ZZV12-4809]|nr:hypothetical protein KIS4809_2308 [Bacillus sp. ZZV12-4809]
MVKKMKISWHQFWFLTYNTILCSTSTSPYNSSLFKKSKYHHLKLIQYL